jgi:inorganic triphosphatase YgiF
MASARPDRQHTQEIELKLLTDEEAARAAWPDAVAAGLSSAEPPLRLLTSTYFDTPGHLLRKAGIALRVRRDGNRILQTVKARASMHGGVSRAMGVESELDGAEPDLAAIADEYLRNRIAGPAAGKPLAPVFETVVRRAEAEVHDGNGTSAMLAVDDATIIAGSARASFRELEIELLSGPVSGLFGIARILLPAVRPGFQGCRRPNAAFCWPRPGCWNRHPNPVLPGRWNCPAKTPSIRRLSSSFASAQPRSAPMSRRC